MKVLIVDDSRAMRMIVRRTLRQAGYDNITVEEAGNGIEGVAMVAKFGPDLILSDWNMPEMSGLDFLKSLRAAGNSVRFGMVTSEGSMEMRGQAEEAGALFLLTKPFGPDDFKTALTAAGF